MFYTKQVCAYLYSIFLFWLYSFSCSALQKFKVQSTLHQHIYRLTSIDQIMNSLNGTKSTHRVLSKRFIAACLVSSVLTLARLLDFPGSTNSIFPLFL